LTDRTDTSLTTHLTDAAGGTTARLSIDRRCLLCVFFFTFSTFTQRRGQSIMFGVRSEGTRFEFRLSVLVLPDTLHWQANCAVPTQWRTRKLICFPFLSTSLLHLLPLPYPFLRLFFHSFSYFPLLILSLVAPQSFHKNSAFRSTSGNVRSKECYKTDAAATLFLHVSQLIMKTAFVRQARHLLLLSFYYVYLIIIGLLRKRVGLTCYCPLFGYATGLLN